jgi:hypothetical protein
VDLYIHSPTRLHGVVHALSIGTTLPYLLLNEGRTTKSSRIEQARGVGEMRSVYINLVGEPQGKGLLGSPKRKC